MPDSIETVAAIESRRKRARFRAWHRGTREMDLILGNFADDAISSMGAAELQEFERLLEVSDSLLLKWFTGAAPVPDSIDTGLFRKIAGHPRQDRT